MKIGISRRRVGQPFVETGFLRSVKTGRFVKRRRNVSSLYAQLGLPISWSRSELKKYVRWLENAEETYANQRDMRQKKRLDIHGTININ